MILFDGYEVDPKLVADKLEDSADLLEKEGWGQGEFKNEDGYCTLGAINYVVCGDAYASDDYWDEEDDKVIPLRRAMAETFYRTLWPTAEVDEYSTVTESIVNWNDHDAEEVQRVLDTFRKAAKAARQKGE